MKIRQMLEQRERDYLSEYASLSSKSLGRFIEEAPCDIRTCYQIDRDRILHCKAFRRLKYKTQVFLAPEGDHYRTRLTHTLEVSQIARTVARALFLNEDLTEAIALGHDLGHTPFGHAGERVLAELVPGGFRHVAQSLRVVTSLEKEGRGLNLTAEVNDGISRHSKGSGPLTGPAVESLPSSREGQIVRLADIIAYVNHDLDDALRAGIVTRREVPADVRTIAGEGHSARINAMVRDLIEQSYATGNGTILLSDAMSGAIAELRAWLFEKVYQADSVNREFIKASRIVANLFDYFMENPPAMVACGGAMHERDPLPVSVADFIAGMTDRYAINLYRELFLPKPWKGL